ncbi:type I-C CRISPR-associated protein Cas8c/Csd1, partial [endosymbiont of Ridgeia piscesae]
ALPACECSDDHPLLGEISSGFGLFQLLGETRYLHEYPAIRAWWQRQDEVGPLDAAGSICLVTGQPSPIASIHEPKIKGVGGAQSSGALLVSFNCDAFTSYDKSQSHNAPVSEAATFRYATALNGLLSGPHSHRHRFSLGDTTIAFWTGETTVAEGWLSAMFSGDLNSNEA